MKKLDGIVKKYNDNGEVAQQGLFKDRVLNTIRG